MEDTKISTYVKKKNGKRDLTQFYYKTTENKRTRENNTTRIERIILKCIFDYNNYSYIEFQCV